MTVAPKKYAWLYGLLPVIAGDITLIILSEFNLEWLYSVFGVLLTINFLVGWLLLRVYKTFEISDNLLRICFTYLPFAKKHYFDIRDIAKIGIVQWSYEGREIPKFIVYLKNDDRKKISFRMSSQETLFRQFIQELKDRDIEVTSVGSFWL